MTRNGFQSLRFATFALAAATLAAAPATQPVRSTDEIEHRFHLAFVSLTNDYQKKIQAIQKDRLDGYRQLLQKAIQKKEFDVAAHFRKQIEQLEDEPLRIAAPKDEPTQSLSLDRILPGTKWEWGQDDKIGFKPDGEVENSGWASRGLVTSWKVIGERTVLLKIERGRPKNLYAILTFSPNFKSYTGFGFEGGIMSKHEPVRN